MLTETSSACRRTSPASVDALGRALLCSWYVSKAKVLGRELRRDGGASLGQRVVRGARLLASATRSTRASPTRSIRPLDLGWHAKRADVSAGFQFYVPTGRYEPGGSDNIGKGMWTYEPFLGTTALFRREADRSVSPRTAFWEFHGKKKDTDVKVGQILTLEGGLGKSFLGGGLIIGGGLLRPVEADRGPARRASCCQAEARSSRELANKHKVFAFGPDVTLPIASKSKLFALVNIRYFWETGARVKTEGQTLVVTATFPVPSVRLQ